MPGQPWFMYPQKPTAEVELGPLEKDMLKPNRILIPVDFSDFSKKAAEYGCAFAKSFGAQLVFLHVVETPVYPIAMGIGAIAPPPLPEDVRPHIEKRMDEFLAAHVDDKVAARGLVVEGTPFVEIVRMCREEKADLCIIPTHGHSGLTHMLLGSTAEKVVRKAPCPVLVLKEEEREFVHP